LHNRIALERSVHLRFAQSRYHRRFKDEIVDRDFGRVVFFTGGLQVSADTHERFGIDLDVEIKMRDRPETGRKTLGDHLAHSGEIDAQSLAR